MCSILGRKYLILKNLIYRNIKNMHLKHNDGNKNYKTMSLIILMWFAREVHISLNYKILLKELWTATKFSLKLNNWDTSCHKYYRQLQQPTDKEITIFCYLWESVNYYIKNINYKLLLELNTHLRHLLQYFHILHLM